MKRVAVVDYGAGNLKSISKALQVLGLEVEIVATEKQLTDRDLLVLPGVGEFGSAMKFIKKTAIDELINLHIKASKPLLAICLGMQLLFNKSEEDKTTSGLKLLAGEIVKFKSMQASLPLRVGTLRFQHTSLRGECSDLRATRVATTTLPVPHMCWNKVRFVNIAGKKKILLNGLKKDEFFYFVHSYYPVCKEREIVFGITDYISKFTSMIVKDNIVATQFHLEKSGITGLKLLKNIIEYFRKI